MSGGSGLPLSYRLQPLAPLLFVCHNAGGLPWPTLWIEYRDDASGLLFSTALTPRLAFERL